MTDPSQLRIFISYAGKSKAFWEPLEPYLRKMYRCEVVWAVDKAGLGGRSVREVEDSMIQGSDVAIFLLTQFSEGVLDELALWKERHRDLDNTLLVGGTGIDQQQVLNYLGFALPACTYIDESDPWKYVPDLFPKIHELLTAPPNLTPDWRLPFNRFVQEHALSIRSKGIPIDKIARFLERLHSSETYQQWFFRINWPRADQPPRIDAYSEEIDCLRLLQSLADSTCAIGGHEVDAVFDALDRLVCNNERPPKKLSGAILFSDASKAALDHVQRAIGSRPYERTHHTRTHAQISPESLGEPISLFPPPESLSASAGFDTYQDVQSKIVQIASQMCKFILCSTYQISISHSLCLSQQSTRSYPMVACTARNTNKEQLAAVADIPILTSTSGESIAWYGQPQRYPTSEYRSHWTYHKLAYEHESPRNLIVHFHPVELLEFYERLRERHGDNVTTKVFRDGQDISGRAGLEFLIFEDFLEYSARSSHFGEFLGQTLSRTESEEKQNVIVWKPNHGVWLIADSNQDQLEILGLLQEIERISGIVAGDLSSYC